MGTCVPTSGFKKPFDANVCLEILRNFIFIKNYQNDQ